MWMAPRKSLPSLRRRRIDEDRIGELNTLVMQPHVHVRHGAVTGIKNDRTETAAGEVPGYAPRQPPIHDATLTASEMDPAQR